MYNWEEKPSVFSLPTRFDLILFGTAAISAILLILVFYSDIERITTESPIIINIMFAPTLAIGFLYGYRITERAVNPHQARGRFKQKIITSFLFIFVMASLFSAVSFAMNGGETKVPELSALENGLIPWILDFVKANGGATFLVVSSITIMAFATKKIVGVGGKLNKFYTFIGTFIFFSMILLSLNNTDPTASQIYLYTFFQAGIVGGAFYQMNKSASRSSPWGDFVNGTKI